MEPFRVYLYVKMTAVHQAHQSRLFKPLLVCTVNDINLKQQIRKSQNMLKRKQRLKIYIFWASTFAFCIYKLKGVCDSFSTQLLLYNTVVLTENIRYSCQPF